MCPASSPLSSSLSLPPFLCLLFVCSLFTHSPPSFKLSFSFFLHILSDKQGHHITFIISCPSDSSNHSSNLPPSLFVLKQSHPLEDFPKKFLGFLSHSLLSHLDLHFFLGFSSITLLDSMEKDSLAKPTWNPSGFSMEMQSNELNCAPQQLPNSLFNANWDNSLDQTDPFESALSSIVSSPIAAAGNGGEGGDMIRELIGRLGSISNSGEISPHSYISSNYNNGSTNTSCYSTPLNSSQRGSLPIENLAQFPADPGFVERAARFSCFGGGGGGGGNFGGQFNLNEAELAYRSMGRIDSGKLSRVSSNQSLKVAAGSQPAAQETNKTSHLDGNSAPDKKFISRFSRASTPENGELGDSREGSSVSQQIPGGDLSVKAEIVTNSRKRKSAARGKAKDSSSSPSVKDAKVVTLNSVTNCPIFYLLFFFSSNFCRELFVKL